MLAEVDAAPPSDRERRSNGAAHVAAITFDVGESGIVPVARSHVELLAGGLAVLLESGVAQNAAILSTIVPASFAGICLTLLPWALCGGTLVLHHPFDAATLGSQMREERCDTLILPGPIAFRLAATDAFAMQGPASIIATWRAPERLAGSSPWRESEHRADRRADLRRSRLRAGASRPRRQAGADPCRSDARAARQRRRGRGR